jgi:hypothetical protein
MKDILTSHGAELDELGAKYGVHRVGESEPDSTYRIRIAVVRRICPTCGGLGGHHRQVQTETEPPNGHVGKTFTSMPCPADHPHIENLALRRECAELNLRLTEMQVRGTELNDEVRAQRREIAALKTALLQAMAVQGAFKPDVNR